MRVFFDSSALVKRLQVAVQSLEMHTLRAMDAIHIGCATAAAVDCFLSADRRQCTAAEAIGL